MKPVYYPKALSDEGVVMQFDLVGFGEARSMIDQLRAQMAAPGPLQRKSMSAGMSAVRVRTDSLCSM
jgi:hypothetical protein